MENTHVVLPRPDDILHRAILCAASSHAGQNRVSGDPYITHPLRVMSRCFALGQSAEVCAAAVLHDVVEDTQTSLHDLASFWEMPESVVSIVSSLTRTKDVDYDDYIESLIKVRGPALLIKTQDIGDHFENLHDLALIDGSFAAKLASKYSKALDMIRKGVANG